jgi:hypothetical protein
VFGLDLALAFSCFTLIHHHRSRPVLRPQARKQAGSRQAVLVERNRIWRASSPHALHHLDSNPSLTQLILKHRPSHRALPSTTLLPPPRRILRQLSRAGGHRLSFLFDHGPRIVWATQAFIQQIRMRRRLYDPSFLSATLVHSANLDGIWIGNIN